MSLASLNFLFRADTENFNRKLKGARNDVDVFAKGIKSLGGLMAGAFSVSAIIGFGKESIAAFDESAKAAAKLLVATKGNVAEQTRLLNNATALQSKTLFDDEAIAGAQTMLRALGLNADQVVRITPLIADFATLMGVDLDTAGKVVAKTFSSSTNALKRYGIDVVGAAGSSERFASITEALTGKVKGLAEATAGAGVSSVTMLKNAWGDIMEVIGSKIAPAVDGVAKRMKAMAEYKSGSGAKSYATQLTEEARAQLVGAKTTEDANKILLEQKRIIEESIPQLEEQQDAYRKASHAGKNFNSEATKARNQAAADATITKSQIEGAGQAIKDIQEQIASGKSLEWVPSTEVAITQEIITLGSLKAKLAELNTQRDEVSLNEVTNIDVEIAAIEKKIKSYDRATGALKRNEIEMEKLADRINQFEEDKKVIVTVIEAIQKTTPVLKDPGEKTLAPNKLQVIGTDTGSWEQTTADINNMTTAMFKADAMANILNDSLKGIGSQLSQGADTWEDYGKSVLNALRAAVAGIIAEGIATAVTASIKASSALGPFAVGIGALAGGAAAGLFSTIVPKFANGGLAYAPQLAIVGDNKNASFDPEVIAPLSKLESMMAVNVTGSTRIRGRDIDIIWTREQQFKQRT